MILQKQTNPNPFQLNGFNQERRKERKMGGADSKAARLMLGSSILRSMSILPFNIDVPLTEGDRAVNTDAVESLSSCPSKNPPVNKVWKNP